MRARLILSAILALNGFGQQGHAEVCTSRSCERFIAIEAGKGVSAYTSYDLQSGSSDVRRLVVVVHGSERDSYGNFANIVTAASSMNELTETLIISPRFKTNDDAPGTNDLYWTDGGWKRGDLSLSSPRISSFEVVDRLAALVIEAGRFPNVEIVTIVGHSAGGQFTHRYAVGSPAEHTYPYLKFNYVVMNPSSYTYLNPYRPLDGAGGAFAVPSGCSRYDMYQYGLLSRNEYMSRLSAADLTSRYLRRDVTYLVGSSDTSRTNNLDTSCSADVQGYTRYERGVLYASHLEHYFPDNNHALSIVPNIGHSSNRMMTSLEGKAAIFPATNELPGSGEDRPSRPMPPTDVEVT